MKILLKYPSRERPEKFVENVKHWESMLSPYNEFVWLFSFDDDDKTLSNIDMSFIQNKFYAMVNSPEGKIAACNANINLHLQNCADDYDMIWLVSDDMSPEIFEFDEIIEKEMRTHYPDWDGCVHINDGLQGLRLCTFSCMGMKYYKRFNYLYHPQYKSTHCDDEFTQLAWANRRMVWIPQILVRHEWIGTNSPDALHQKNHALMTSVDQHTYQRRSNAGFPKNNVS